MKTLWLVLSVGNLAKALMEVRARLRAGDRSGERPAFSGIFIVGALSQYVQTYLVELLHGFVQMNMTEGLLGHLLRNPVSYFAKRQVGDLFARVKAQDDLLSATRQAGAAARESGSRFRAGVARIESLTRLVQTSRASLAATQMGYKVGSRASTDVLRAADVFYTNRRDLNLIRARYETLVALLQLQASTAALDVDAVARVNAMLVPSASSVAPPPAGGTGPEPMPRPPQQK